jgi:hypothetical protein
MNESEELITRFKVADKNNFTDFSKCKKPLDMALWVLLIATEASIARKLTAMQIATIIIETQNISVEVKSIQYSLNRASDNVHRYYEDSETYFAIMQPGKDYILSLRGNDVFNAFYFEPNTKFSAKQLLKNQILNSLTGSLRIVDPYCGERMLDILSDVKDRSIKILTNLENIRERERSQFLREIRDFKTENANIEFRNYSERDIHDRYIMSEDSLVLIGHSLKDLGGKETFAVILNRNNYGEIYQSLSGNFNLRWESSIVI